MNGLTNATSQDVAWCPKHQTAKGCCWFDGHSLTRLGSQKTWVFISLHRLQICHSKIFLILARPLPIGYFTFYYSFFLIFNRMDAWSLMRGDAFIHFVCGSQRVNIRLGVLLLIPKSPQITLSKLRIGHTKITHSYLLKGKQQPMCYSCQTKYTVKHILIECTDLAHKEKPSIVQTIWRKYSKTLK